MKKLGSSYATFVIFMVFLSLVNFMKSSHLLMVSCIHLTYPLFVMASSTLTTYKTKSSVTGLPISVMNSHFLKLLLMFISDGEMGFLMRYIWLSGFVFPHSSGKSILLLSLWLPKWLVVFCST